MDTFSPPKQPSRQGAAIAFSHRVKVAKFGDAYEQRTPDGLNPVNRKLSLTWKFLSQSDTDAMTSFFNAHVGVAFLYTPPGEAQMKWVIDGDQYRVDKGRGITNQIDVTLRQVFDL